MATIVACPSCGGKLRVPDDLRDQLVRCPACDHTFDSSQVLPPSPPPAPQSPPPPPDLPLRRALDEPENKPSGLAGGFELNLSLDDAPPVASLASPPPEPQPPTGKRPPRLADAHDDLKTCPACGKHLHRSASRCPHCGERLRPPDGGWDAPRRDSEPHRGAMILVVGILSLVFVSMCGPVGVILGLVAWIMGRTDLRKIRAGLMDPEGEGPTQAGHICGIIGTVVNLLWTLGCASMVGLMILTGSQSTPPPVAPKPPRVVPMPVPPQPVQPAPKRNNF
jgi:predicted Zn finger-like uncharacterized protein